MQVGFGICNGTHIWTAQIKSKCRYYGTRAVVTSSTTNVPCNRAVTGERAVHSDADCIPLDRYLDFTPPQEEAVVGGVFQNSSNYSPVMHWPPTNDHSKRRNHSVNQKGKYARANMYLEQALSDHEGRTTHHDGEAVESSVRVSLHRTSQGER